MFPMRAFETACALAALIAIAGAGLAGAAQGKPAAIVTLKANLAGVAEKPTPGDPKGSGSATLRVDPAKSQVCYELQVTGIGPATMAHIHQAGPKESGPPMATLTAPGPDGKSSGCVDVGPIMLQGLTGTPAAYYVNVHTNDYKAGALRGQLHRQRTGGQ